jgi:ribose-phosphate pyrophosphokinase
MLLGFKEYEAQAQHLAEALELPYARVGVHHFPDGECKVTLPGKLPVHVVFCRSLDHPDDKLIELLLAATTARELGARRLTLVAPYLCYMRQDKAFAVGEAVSQSIIGRFLAGLFDDVITVDPHLHRTHHLADAVPATHAVALSATAVMRDFLHSYCEAHPESHGDTVLLGPDSESEQWVRSLAEAGGLAYGVACKERLGDREIRITLPDLDLSSNAVVLVDDVISSGQTIAIALEACLKRGAERVDVLVTHPLFAQGAIERLRQAGVGEIWSTDSIPHPSNCIVLTNLIAEAVQRIV